MRAVSERWTVRCVCAASLLFVACQGVGSGVDYFTSGNDETAATTTGGDDDGGDPVFECQPGAIGTCGPGAKCSALANGGAQNLYRCVPDDGLAEAYEGCLTAPTTGQDGCLDGTVCLAADVDTPQGLCLPLCSGSSDCANGDCITDLGVGTSVCGSRCNPLEPLACVGAQVCRPGGSSWVCRYTADVDVGMFGDACDADTGRGCGAGLLCQQGDITPQCDAFFCCASICDIEAIDACVAPAECIALTSTPDPGLENLGGCSVPQ